MGLGHSTSLDSDNGQVMLTVVARKFQVRAVMFAKQLGLQNRTGDADAWDNYPRQFYVRYRSVRSTGKR